MADFPLDDRTTWEIFLGALRTGAGMYRAARCVGMSRKAVETYLSDRPNKRAEALEAHQEANEQVEDVLWELAVNGDLEAIKMWLKNRSPERWATEQSNVNIAVLTPEMLQQMVRGELGPAE